MNHTTPDTEDTFDLTPYFRRALDGEPPFDLPEHVALDRAERGGRRRRARVIASRSAVAVMCAATVGGALVLLNPLAAHPSGSSSTLGIAARSTASVSASPTAAQPQVTNPLNKRVVSRTGATPPAALMVVSLPDPAPGFPIRNSRDYVGQADGGANPPFWTDVFRLAKTPAITVTNATGLATSEIPTGPEVTVMVATSGTLSHLGANPSRCEQGTGAYRVAGMPADVEQYVEKGDHFTQLCFTKNQFHVLMVGSTGVTTTELVALGNSISGLD